jgi:hypothetical protein
MDQRVDYREQSYKSGQSGVCSKPDSGAFA